VHLTSSSPTTSAFTLAIQARLPASGTTNGFTWGYEFRRGRHSVMLRPSRLLALLAVRHCNAAPEGFYIRAFRRLVTSSTVEYATRPTGRLPGLVSHQQEGQPFSAAHNRDQIEIWDADDFLPWEGLRWSRVRVLRYRQHKPDGSVLEAYWLTDFSTARVGSRSLYAMAKSRWEIENQGFNDGKTRYGMEHIRHHHPNSMLLVWLLTVLAITIERLYRLRFLHRGTHSVRSAIDLLFALVLSLGRLTSASPDTS
jgi:hypothetical protein